MVEPAVVLVVVDDEHGLGPHVWARAESIQDGVHVFGARGGEVAWSFGRWSPRTMSATIEGEYGTLALSYNGSPGLAFWNAVNQPRSVPSGLATSSAS
jgi:hypothetical protein